MKKFKSTTGSPVRIALLSGHTAWVNLEFTELDDRFHAEAYSAQCVSEDMLKSEAMESIPVAQAEAIIHTKSIDDKILDVISEMVDNNELENFSKSSGAPDARIIASRVGERISSHKRDEIWYRYQEANKAD